METYLLYIDILGFKELVKREPILAAMIYEAIDSSHVHDEDSLFNTVVFSDTIISHNKKPISDNRREIVESACEFVQELQYRFVEQSVYFRAILLLGEFDNYRLKNIRCIYGPALIDAHLQEKEIPALGLFIDDAANADNSFFSTTRFGKNLSFVFLNRSFEKLQKDSGGILPVDTSCLIASPDEYREIVHDIRMAQEIYNNMHKQEDFRIRTKYIISWHLLRGRYPKILDALEAKNFSPRAICDDTNFWKFQYEEFKASRRNIRRLGAEQREDVIRKLDGQK